jgi:hypothetical protein
MSEFNRPPPLTTTIMTAGEPAAAAAATPADASHLVNITYYGYSIACNCN